MKKNLDKIQIKITNARNIESDETLTRLIDNTMMKVKKNGRRLNKFRTNKPLDQVKVERLQRLAEKDGYSSLQAFAYCYRDDIKMSYVTLYRRMLHNRDVLNTLIKRKMVDIYYLDVKRENATNKTRFKIFNNKKDEFVKFIIDNFLTECQK